MFGWANYMKYDELSVLTNNMFANTAMANETDVNVYLDIGSMVDVLYADSVKESNDPTELASVVLNLAGHIRAFFKTCGVYATLFIVYSRNDWRVLREVCPDYNAKSIKRTKTRVGEYIRDSMKIVKMIVPYLNRVYYIGGEAECGAMIYSAIRNERSIGNNHPNIIFTKEINLLQIPAMDPYSVIYNKNTRKQKRVCYGVNQMNVIETYLKLTRRFNPAYTNPNAAVLIRMLKGVPHFIDVTNRVREIGEMVREFDPRKLSYLIALTSLFSRNLWFLMSWTEALKGLHRLETFVDDPRWVYDRLPIDLKIYDRIGVDEFIGRYRAVSVAHQADLYSKSKHPDYRIDLMNSDELKYLNDHYFVTNFIDLNKF